MVDRAKFQVEVLKNMLSTKPNMRRINISDDEIGITDGYHVVVFQKSALKIRFEDLLEMEYDLSCDKEDTPMVFDSNVRKMTKNCILAKLCSKDKNTISIVNAKFLSVFSGCDFYSKGGISPVYAFDGLGSLTGFFMPIRAEEF